MGSTCPFSGTTPTLREVPSFSTISTPLAPRVVMRSSTRSRTSASVHPVLDSSRSHS
ncbi:Uncharacterised protein [Mycobacteroides abscessus subsp. abscessus]|nr:Uncharacterised protein [Mycobacteroides abscessus subsp. abscessus]